MKLELRKAADGSHFVICICGERSGRQIVVPLSEELSGRIETMLKVEGVGTGLLLPSLAH